MNVGTIRIRNCIFKNDAQFNSKNTHQTEFKYLSNTPKCEIFILAE